MAFRRSLLLPLWLCGSSLVSIVESSCIVVDVDGAVLVVGV